MPSTPARRRTVLVLSAALVLAACSESTPLAPEEPQPTGEFDQIQTAFTALSGGASLVSCPSTDTRSTSAVVGILGGTVALDGTSVTIPLGAVLLPTTITLTLPASDYMEVDLTANSREHFNFLFPVRVTIDYSRCPAGAFDDVPLSAWYIDDLTLGLLQFMGGNDDRANRTLTFPTTHFSGFSIAQ